MDILDRLTSDYGMIGEYGAFGAYGVFGGLWDTESVSELTCRELHTLYYLLQEIDAEEEESSNNSPGIDITP